MFEGARGVAVLAASDHARARSFYEDVLGFEPFQVMEDTGSVMYMVGDTPLLVYVTDFAGTAQNTAFSIGTPDLDRDMAALREKGVSFAEYEFEELRTVNGVAEMDAGRTAWFTDSEGNILALIESDML
jgi:predicted enzyme related to lactoylglutathione lyase